MKHCELNTGVLRAYLDDQLHPTEVSVVKQHLEDCLGCRKELEALKIRAAYVSAGFDRLPQGSGNVSAAWAAFQRKREELPDGRLTGWSIGKVWYLAGGALATAALIVVCTVGPVRVWAENLLAIFRVEHFTILELNPTALPNLENNQLLNQTVSHILSDEVVVTQAPQKPQPVANAADASKLAGFPVKLLAGSEPSALLVESGLGIQMKLNRDRLQSILDESGRSDLQIPANVDGATISLRVPTGILAKYGHCGNLGARFKGETGENTPRQRPDSTCLALMELPSPVVSAPPNLNPSEIAQVALQFMGMSSNDAANFTQTVDWTSTLVFPVLRGQTTYKQMPVNGNEGVLLRPKNMQPSGQDPATVTQTSDRFTLMWIDSGILYMLHGSGDDTTAINLASQLE